MTDYIFCFNEYSKARHLLLGSQKKALDPRFIATKGMGWRGTG